MENIFYRPLVRWLAATSFILTFFSLQPPQTAYASPGINSQIPFEGYLRDAGGSNLSGTYDMQFDLFDDASGGTNLWTGTYSSGNGNPVTVASGIFAVLLGSGTGNSLAGVNFNEDNLYLEVTVAGEVMSPRYRLGAAAYAFNTDTLDGYDASDFILASSSSALDRVLVKLSSDFLNVVGNNAYQIIPFDVASYNPNNNFNTSSYKYEVPADGDYHVDVVLSYRNNNDSSNDPLDIVVRKNDTTDILTLRHDISDQINAGGNLTVTLSGLVPSLVNGDELSIEVYDADDILVTLANSSHFSIQQLPSTSLTVINSNDFTGTAGSLVFSNGTSVTEDNENLFWDNTNNNLHLGATSTEYNNVANFSGDSSLILENGIICVDNGGLNCDDAVRTAGTIYANSTSVGGVDIAENYPTDDDSLLPGELVVIDTNKPAYITRSGETGGNEVPLGIVSTKPGLLLGGYGAKEFEGEHQAAVALTGRVPVFFSAENGGVQAGDTLIASHNNPGHAMAACGPIFCGDARSVAIALEQFTETMSGDTDLVQSEIVKSTGEAEDTEETTTTELGDMDPKEKDIDDTLTREGTGRLMVFVEMAGSSHGAIVNQEPSEGLIRFLGETANHLGKFISRQLSAGIGFFDRLFAREINSEINRTQSLCVGEVCVDEDAFRELLKENHIKSIKVDTTVVPKESESTSLHDDLDREPVSTTERQVNHISNVTENSIDQQEVPTDSQEDNEIDFYVVENESQTEEETPLSQEIVVEDEDETNNESGT